MQIIFGALFKRYLLIDQQIARNFVHYSDCLSNPPSLLSTQLINSFNYLGSHPITVSFNWLEIKRKRILGLQYH